MGFGRQTKTFEDLIKNQVAACTDKYYDNYKFNQMTSFCGYHSVCKVNSDTSMAIAKNNVERYYTAVGVLEEMEKLVEILDYTYPSYFKGMLDQYRQDKIRANTGRRVEKNPPSEEVLNSFRSMLDKYDYMFYKYIKQRFHDTYAAFVDYNRRHPGK